MKDFDIVKYLKENKQGSYGRFNSYVDLKPLKEEEENTPATDDSELDPDTVPYEGADDQLTGLGDTDSFEQADIVSENEEEYPDYTRIMDLGGERIEQGIMSLLDDGFSEEDILELCKEFIEGHAQTGALGGYADTQSLNEVGIKHISTVIPRLDDLARRYGFEMQGDVNQNPRGDGDTIATWKDTTPGYQRQFVDLYVENGELWVNWGSFGYNQKYADGSGNDPVSELFKEKNWKNFFGTLERRKNREL